MSRARFFIDRRSAASVTRHVRRDAGHATLLSVIDQAFVSFANFATTVFVGKFAGAAMLGEYSLAFTALVVLMAVQDCLLASPYSALCVQLRRSARRRFAGNLLLVATALAVIAALALLSAGQLTRELPRLERVAPVVQMLALAVPAALLRELVRRIALAQVDMATVLRIDIAASVLQLVTLVIIAALAPVTTEGALLSIAVGGFGGVGVAALINRRDWRIRRRSVQRHFMAAFTMGRWLLAARVVSVVHTYIVPWLLGLMVGLEAVGGFTAAFGLIAVANPVRLAVLNVMGPEAARAWASEGARRLRQVIGRGALMLTLVTVVLVAPVAIFAEALLRMLYGPEYSAHGNVLVVLAVSLVATCPGSAADYGLRALQRPEGVFVASLCGLLVTIISTVALVPLLGVMAGAYALTLGSATLSIGRWLTFRRLLHAQGESTGAAAKPERVAEGW